MSILESSAIISWLNDAKYSLISSRLLTDRILQTTHKNNLADIQTGCCANDAKKGRSLSTEKLATIIHLSWQPIDGTSQSQ